jgi:hypothetical protein
MHRDLRSWLSVRPEYPNFQLNETFFKPFEHLICTEQCDSIVENQVKIKTKKFVCLNVRDFLDC